MSEDSGSVKETLVCHAVIGRTKGKHKIFQVPIKCQFVDPMLHPSTRHIRFHIDKDVNDVLTTQSSSFKLRNVSALPLRLELQTHRLEYNKFIKIFISLRIRTQIRITMYFNLKYTCMKLIL